MTDTFKQAQWLSRLSKSPPSSLVRVVVRPSFTESVDKEGASPDPKKFSSSADYRSALIEKQKAQLKPLTADLIQRAIALGLRAHPASTLSAVMLEGSAADVTRLIKSADIDSVIFDSDFQI